MAVTVVVPSLGMTMEEATLLRWLVPHGGVVHKGQPIFEAESEKISFEGEAEADGVLHHLASEGETLPPGATLALILAPGEQAPESPLQAQSPDAAPDRRAHPASPETAAPSRVAASPVARRLAAELGIDLSTVHGTGPGGRIVESDIRAAAGRGPGAGMPRVRRRVPIRGARQVIAARMLESVRSAAQFTLYLDVDMTAAIAYRRSLPGGNPVATIDLVVFAAAQALTKHPRVNAGIDNDEIVEYADVNIGVAVALPDGLIVPVIRGVDRLAIEDIATRRSDLAGRARRGALTKEDVTGGTFTVSVLGLVDSFTPIVNPPEAAILGIGRTISRPVAIDGEIAIRPVATLSLTVDHRLVDGEPAARFLRDVARNLEHPATE